MEKFWNFLAQTHCYFFLRLFFLAIRKITKRCGEFTYESKSVYWFNSRDITST